MRGDLHLFECPTCGKQDILKEGVLGIDAEASAMELGWRFGVANNEFHSNGYYCSRPCMEQSNPESVRCWDLAHKANKRSSDSIGRWDDAYMVKQSKCFFCNDRITISTSNNDAEINYKLVNFLNIKRGEVRSIESCKHVLHLYTVPGIGYFTTCCASHAIKMAYPEETNT